MFSKHAGSSWVSLRERRITTVCCDEEGGESARCGWVGAGPGPLGERRITTVCCDGARFPGGEWEGFECYLPPWWGKAPAES